MKNWQIWLRGLISAGIGGASTAITTMIVAPDTFNLETGKQKLIAVAGVSAIVAVANFLKQSPLPDTVNDGKISDPVK